MKLTTEQFTKLRKGSTLEIKLADALTAAGLKFVREFQFAKCIDRKWKADFAFPDRGILVEIEGGTWNGGGHVRGKGYQANCEKYNAAALLGYRVLRYTTDDIAKRMEVVIEDIKAILR